MGRPIAQAGEALGLATTMGFPQGLGHRVGRAGGPVGEFPGRRILDCNLVRRQHLTEIAARQMLDQARELLPRWRHAL